MIFRILKHNMKYVVITGGVISGLGKGITASSIGLLLKECGLSVTSIKIDPYLNIDASKMSPYEHGEVFVLDDGGQVDLDLGNYERFLDITLTKNHNITTGKIYKKVLDQQESGYYLGKTIQIVPHITDTIKEWIRDVSKISVELEKKPDICIIELGGTVGDIESMVFLEALRQLKNDVESDNFCLIHVSLIVDINNEQKSKPTQHSVISLRSAGLIPDMIVCRSKDKINKNIIKKISMFSMVSESNVICLHNVDNIYKVPLLMLSQNMCNILLKRLKINKTSPLRILKCEQLLRKMDKNIKIGVVGKYTGLEDSYISLIKALKSAGLQLEVNIEIVWIESSKMVIEELEKLNGILVPGGFGKRGIEGKVNAIRYARENNTPCFGICLGMQMMVIEYARNVCKIKNANTDECEECGDDIENVIKLMGGDMRVGKNKCIIKEETVAYKIFNKTEIYQRHRHKYAVNNKYEDILEKNGLIISGKSDSGIVEIVEMNKNKFFVGCQFHPEYKSGPINPTPLFIEFIRSCI